MKSTLSSKIQISPKQVFSENIFNFQFFLFFKKIDEFLVKSTDIAFKHFGLKGYIVKLQRTILLQTAPPQTSTERPYLMPPQLTITDRGSSNVPKSTVSKSTKLKVFSFKYDINKKSYIGEIYDNTENYYDYNMSNRSRIRLETNKSFRISSKQHENVLITNSLSSSS